MRLALVAALTGLVAAAGASPTGLNVIPTTDLVPLQSWVLAFQNSNPDFAAPSLFEHPLFIAETQAGLESWLEAGLDYEQTPDLTAYAVVFNVKALVMQEDEHQPNFAVGMWNVAAGQAPGYYVAFSKTLNYDQEQEERFKAHHRRNRKLLGRRVHLGMMLDGHGIFQPFAGTDLQLNEAVVFQADYVHGAGNTATAGIAWVLPDQRTVLNPAFVFSNSGDKVIGLSINLSHQFNL